MTLNLNQGCLANGFKLLDQLIEKVDVILYNKVKKLRKPAKSGNDSVH